MTSKDWKIFEAATQLTLKAMEVNFGRLPSAATHHSKYVEESVDYAAQVNSFLMAVYNGLQDSLEKDEA